MDKLLLILLQLLTAVGKIKSLIEIRRSGQDVTPEMLDEAEAEADAATDAWKAELARLRAEVE